jgi:hypothetical protein
MKTLAIANQRGGVGKALDEILLRFVGFCVGGGRGIADFSIAG